MLTTTAAAQNIETRETISARRPEWAQALIIAQFEENTSDSQSDYFGSKTVRVVALAWSKSTRDNFAEMRKAAALFSETADMGPGLGQFKAIVVAKADIRDGGSAYWKGSRSHWHQELQGRSGVEFTTRAAAEAFIVQAGAPYSISFDGIEAEFEWEISEEKIEHREKYSMGHGYYLSTTGRYSGWQVRKVNPSYVDNQIDTTILDAPKPTGPKGGRRTATETTSAPAVSVTVNAAKSGVEVRFDSKPAADILSDLKANGWRWSRFSSCWYHNDTPDARAYAQRLYCASAADCTCEACNGDDSTPDPLPPAPEPTDRGAAEKLRALAAGMDAAIAGKMDPGCGRQNLTPRRARMADSMRLDGERLQKVQAVLRKLADAHDDPTLWAGLETVYAGSRALRTKAAIERLAFEGRTWIPARSAYTAGTLDRLAGEIVPKADDTVRRMERELVGLKIPGFFPTPRALAAEVVGLADIQPGQRVLEPSAGKGDLAEAIHEFGDIVGKRFTLDVCEVNVGLARILEAKLFRLIAGDVFGLLDGSYDRIIMNPPFENGQDVNQVQHCFDHLLAPGGRLVAIVSESVFHRTDRKYADFREWMSDYLTNDPEQIRGGFSGAQAFRQTGVTTRIVVLEKPTR